MDDTLPHSFQRASALPRLLSSLHALFHPPPHPRPPARRCTCVGTTRPCPMRWSSSVAVACPIGREPPPPRPFPSPPLSTHHAPIPSLFSPSGGLWVPFSAWEHGVDRVMRVWNESRLEREEGGWNGTRGDGVLGRSGGVVRENDDALRNNNHNALDSLRSSLLAHFRSSTPPAADVVLAHAVNASIDFIQSRIRHSFVSATRAALRTLSNTSSTPISTLVRTSPFAEEYLTRGRRLPSSGRVQKAFGWEASRDFEFGGFDQVVLLALRGEILAAQEALRASESEAIVALMDQWIIGSEAAVVVWPGDVADTKPHWKALKDEIVRRNATHLLRSGDGFHFRPVLIEAFSDMIFDALAKIA
jgi:hypothetical protein